MRIDDLMARLDAVSEEADGGFLARCPAHGDSRPSLRVWIGEDRKIRFTCRAGCPPEEIVSALGLRWVDMFEVEGDVPTVAVEPPAPVIGRHINALREYVSEVAAQLGDQHDAEAASSRAYIAERFGLDIATAAELQIGYSAVGHDFRYLSASFTAHPRITVPLRDFAGVVRGLQGRDISGNCPARWLSLTNPKGHRWGTYGVLKGGDARRRDAPSGADAGPVIVTEGPGDGLTVAAIGYDAVVVRGASLVASPELIGELADGLQGRTVLSAGDGDSAGRKFNAALAEGFARRGITVHALELPVGASDITAWREDDPAGFARAFDAAVTAARQAIPSRSPAPVAKPEKPAVAVKATPLVELQKELQIDGGNVRHANIAEFVANECCDLLRYVEGVGWYCWNGSVWGATGDDGAALQAVTKASQRLLAIAGEVSWAMEVASKMLNGRERGYIVREMAAQPRLRTTVDDFDRATHLLTFQNGTVDLRTGELHEHSADDMLTQIANVDYVPGAACPRWERFVAEIFPGQPELQDYFQRFLGLCITGEVRDHLLSVWYGEHGRNGKGATVRTMDSAFGPSIIKQVDMSLYEGGRGREPHTEDLATLRGARMVVAQEGEEGAPMNTARLKKHSGGDRIQARHLYGKKFEFQPTFTLVLATNHLPEFSAGGAPLWARTKAIFFGEHFVGDRVDPDLEPTIQGPEREGVAAWVVRGAMAYYAAGRLTDVPAVTAATTEHRDKVDPLKDLVGELFEYDEGAEVSRTDFNRRLKEWRDDNGDRSARYSPSNVKKRLMSRGVYERRTVKGWVYVGVRFPEDRPTVRDDPAKPTDIFGQAS